MEKIGQQLSAGQYMEANLAVEESELLQVKEQLMKLSEAVKNIDCEGIDSQYLKEQLEKQQEFVHKECVKVYRNVQAVMEEASKNDLEKITQIVKAEIDMSVLTEMKIQEKQRKKTAKTLTLLTTLGGLLITAQLVLLVLWYFAVI